MRFPDSPLLRFLVPGFFGGLTVGVMGVLIVSLSGAKLRASALQEAQASSLTPPERIVHCATDVDTTGWNVYRNASYGISLKMPPDYSVTEEKNRLLIRNGTGADSNEIELTKVRGGFLTEVDSSMQQAGWKVADRQVYALTTPYFSEAPYTSLWSKYLFVRDFPQQGANGRYVMIKALITLPFRGSDHERARAAGIMDVESVLTVPEQILSTFRFLTYEELAIKASPLSSSSQSSK